LVFEALPGSPQYSHIAHTHPTLQGRNYTVTGYPFVVEDVPDAPEDPPTPMGGAAMLNPGFLMMFGLGGFNFDHDGDY